MFSTALTLFVIPLGCISAQKAFPNCDVACADSGYANTAELERIDAQDIKVVVPSQRQAAKKESKPFDNANIHHELKKDCYICPEGHTLTYRFTNNYRQSKHYKITEISICKQCRHFGVCTNNPRGRTMTRLLKEEHVRKLEAQ